MTSSKSAKAKDILFEWSDITGRSNDEVDQAMTKIRENLSDLGQFKIKLYIKTLMANYKSIPLKDGDVIDATVKKNIEKGGKKSEGTAPTARMNKDKEIMKQIVNIVFKDVNARNRNWNTLLRAVEKEMKNAVNEILTEGQATDKRITQRGFFVFYTDKENMLKWLNAQLFIGQTLANFMVNHVKNAPVAVPSGKDEFFKIFSNVDKIDRPPLGNSKDAFKTILTGSSQVRIADIIDVFVILTPGRALLTREEILLAEHDVKWVTSIRDIYDQFYLSFKQIFQLKPIKGSAKDGLTLNQLYGELISVIRMSVGQFRIHLFGESKRLGENDKRTFPELQINVS